MRVLLQYFSTSQTHNLQRIFHDIARRAFVRGQLEASYHLVEGVPDSVEGIVDLVRILKDCLDLLTVFKTLFPVEARDVAPAIEDLSRRQRGEAEDGVGESGFAASALARNGCDRRSVLRDDQVEISQCGDLLAAL